MVLLLGTQSVFGLEPPPPQWRRAVEWNSNNAELIAIPIDQPIYENTQRDHLGLRVLDGAGNQVPYLMRYQSEERSSRSSKRWRASQISAQPLPEENGLSIEFQLPENKSVPEKIRIVTPLDNFEHRVRIFSIKTDGTEPELLHEDTIFDYSKWIDARHTTILLPDTEARKLRIVIDKITAEQRLRLTTLTKELQQGEEQRRTEQIHIESRPFRIDRIELLGQETTTRQRKKETKVAVKWNATINEDEQATVLTVETHQEPMVAFQFDSNLRNFRRSIVIATPAINTQQADSKLIVRGSLHRFSYKDLQDEQLRIRFPVQRHKQYTITIPHGDNPPIDINKIIGLQQTHEAVLIAEPGQTYDVVYGKHFNDSNGYDTAPIVAAIKKSPKVTAVSLAKVSAPELVDLPPQPMGNPLNSIWVVGPFITILILILGWGLYNAAQKIEAIETTEPPEGST